MANILIVDDQQTTRQLLNEVLCHMGHHVTQAASGQEALDLCRNENFDLVILDYRMPGMDGLEVAGQLRGKAPFVLHTTDHENQDIRRKAMSLGALDVIGKVDNVKRFKNAITKLIGPRL